jgi:hypothetical protein
MTPERWWITLSKDDRPGYVYGKPEGAEGHVGEFGGRVVEVVPVLPPDEDTGGAYIQCIPAQEAAYWTARREGIPIDDFQIATLLRAAAPYIRRQALQEVKSDSA